MTDQTGARETIFALSSGALPAGVAVVRLSGGGVRETLRAMIGTVPEPRHARLAAIRDAQGAVLDRGLTLFFPGPASFTGEDCAELHLHGGRAVVAAVMAALGARPGLRPAEPGEFTRRAFVNGKVDLTGAEALADLITAETEAQRRFALASGEARHEAIYGAWRERLIRARAMIEAELDFSDEEDVPGSVADAVWADMARLRGEMESHADRYRDAEIIREGYRVVILGAPNAGKSSLLNALAQRDIAIVTEEPGTTRDALETALDINGAKVMVTDTAGIRARPGRVEAIGIERAMEKAAAAELIVALEDATAPVTVSVPEGARTLRVASKIDLPMAPSVDAGNYGLLLSARTGQGMDALIARIGEAAAAHTRHAGETLPFRERHVGLLREAVAHLTRAEAMDAAGLELRAEELRLAGAALGRIAGTVDVEDVLDTIFSQFCIGK